MVGDSRPAESLRLIETTQRALATAIETAGPGVKLGDVSAAIGEVLRGAGYSVNTDFGGHGIGTTMHQDPHVPNDGRAGRGMKMRPGQLLALEPWVMSDTDELVTDDDGWTLRSATGCRTAHSEHTVAITEDGVEVLTLPQPPLTPAPQPGSTRPRPVLRAVTRSNGRRGGSTRERSRYGAGHARWDGREAARARGAGRGRGHRGGAGP